MRTILRAEELNLPPEVLRKLKGKRVELTEVEGGFLLRPVGDPIAEARGCLRERAFSSK